MFPEFENFVPSKVVFPVGAPGGGTAGKACPAGAIETVCGSL